MSNNILDQNEGNCQMLQNVQLRVVVRKKALVHAFSDAFNRLTHLSTNSNCCDDSISFQRNPEIVFVHSF